MFYYYIIIIIRFYFGFDYDKRLRDTAILWDVFKPVKDYWTSVTSKLAPFVNSKFIWMSLEYVYFHRRIHVDKLSG